MISTSMSNTDILFLSFEWVEVDANGVVLPHMFNGRLADIPDVGTPNGGV